MEAGIAQIELGRPNVLSLNRAAGSRAEGTRRDGRRD